jgi:hypothetical protein
VLVRTLESLGFTAAAQVGAIHAIERVMTDPTAPLAPA